MKPYLQRLYDAAGGLAARPAQRSGSPLLAVDQRLASPAYAGSFLLALPGGTEPMIAPHVDPDPTTPSPPAHREPGPVHEPAPFQAAEPGDPTPVTDPGRPAAPRPRTEQQPAPRPAPGVLREPAAQPESRPDTTVEPPPTVPEPAPAAEPPRRRRDHPPARAVEQAQRAEPAPPAPAAPRPAARLTAAPAPVRRGDLHVVPQPPAPSVPRPASPQEVPSPPLMRRVPTAPAEPLPPPAPAAPRTDDLPDLAGRVRRLVREALSAVNPSGDQHEREGETAGPAAPRGRTAEAMSVIGPLDRPPRATMLYGMRLR